MVGILIIIGIACVIFVLLMKKLKVNKKINPKHTNENTDPEHILENYADILFWLGALFSIAGFIGGIAFVYGFTDSIVLPVIVGVAAAFIIHVFFNVYISYLRVHIEISRSLKKILDNKMKTESE
jgi:hypothetical protein